MTAWRRSCLSLWRCDAPELTKIGRASGYISMHLPQDTQVTSTKSCSYTARLATQYSFPYLSEPRLHLVTEYITFRYYTRTASARRIWEQYNQAIVTKCLQTEAAWRQCPSGPSAHEGTVRCWGRFSLLAPLKKQITELFLPTDSLKRLL